MLIDQALVVWWWWGELAASDPQSAKSRISYGCKKWALTSSLRKCQHVFKGMSWVLSWEHLISSLQFCPNLFFMCTESVKEDNSNTQNCCSRSDLEKCTWVENGREKREELWCHGEIIDIAEYQGTRIHILSLRADIKADKKGSGPQSKW